MFNKNSSDAGVTDKKDIETIIGASVKVEGNFVCEGNIVIDGQVKGNVQTNGFLQIGNNAVVVADVKASDARIGGEVKGSINIDGYLELSETAKILGDIETLHLSVAKGAQINGRCVMGSAASTKANPKHSHADQEDVISDN